MAERKITKKKGSSKLEKQLSNLEYELEEYKVENHDLKEKVKFLSRENKMLFSPKYHGMMMFKHPKHFVSFITDTINIAFVIIIMVVAFFNHTKGLFIPTVGVIILNIISLFLVKALERSDEEEDPGDLGRLPI